MIVPGLWSFFFRLEGPILSVGFKREIEILSVVTLLDYTLFRYSVQVVWCEDSISADVLTLLSFAEDKNWSFFELYGVS